MTILFFLHWLDSNSYVFLDEKLSGREKAWRHCNYGFSLTRFNLTSYRRNAIQIPAGVYLFDQVSAGDGTHQQALCDYEIRLKLILTTWSFPNGTTKQAALNKYGVKLVSKQLKVKQHVRKLTLNECMCGRMQSYAFSFLFNTLNKKQPVSDRNKIRQCHTINCISNTDPNYFLVHAFALQKNKIKAILV